MDSTFFGQILFTQSFTMAVDTFFFLSAFLAAYFLLKECAKKPHFKFFRCWLSKFCNRCLRIWPAFAVALFGSWFLMPLLVDSPGMDPQIYATCGEDYGWLQALLFTNNILPNRGTGNCFGHTWYLACDMQLYFLLPPIVMLYMRTRERDLASEKSSGRIAFFVFLVATVIGSCCYSVIMAWDSETGWSSYMNDGDLSTAYNKDYYAMPWTRYPAYYTGVCCAIMWFEKEVRIGGI
jgi:peptidoglycan/LPS O-acetylase OafA/YrhL